mmetsp:Transcript_13099/g.33878  ORF Transcript_13099/g.33878 Transcript_13099/m.33878 type:complete len:221 (+) Transcript_13099:187-849(+)
MSCACCRRWWTGCAGGRFSRASGSRSSPRPSVACSRWASARATTSPPTTGPAWPPSSGSTPPRPRSPSRAAASTKALRPPKASSKPRRGRWSWWREAPSACRCSRTSRSTAWLWASPCAPSRTCGGRCKSAGACSRTGARAGSSSSPSTGWRLRTTRARAPGSAASPPTGKPSPAGATLTATWRRSSGKPASSSSHSKRSSARAQRSPPSSTRASRLSSK